MPVKSVSVLLIDAGNSRFKWQLRSAGQVLQQGVAGYADSLTETLPAADKVMVAAVRHHELLQQRLQQQAPELVWLSEPLLQHPAFRHCYADPPRLGVDRWLAMLGARRLTDKPLLVIDAGTALTIDLLDADNQHQGGYIVPGQGLAAQALFSSTERVRQYLDEAGGDAMTPGRGTLGCVTAGLKYQALAMVQAVVTEYPQYVPLVTGGDGEWLARQAGLTFKADLIMDGMDSLYALDLF